MNLNYRNAVNFDQVCRNIFSQPEQDLLKNNRGDLSGENLTLYDLLDAKLTNEKSIYAYYTGIQVP